jgi:hypothetical protein
MIWFFPSDPVRLTFGKGVLLLWSRRRVAGAVFSGSSLSCFLIDDVSLSYTQNVTIGGECVRTT